MGAAAGAWLSAALLRRPWLTVFTTVAGVYLLTAHWAVGQNSDSQVAAWPAHAFVTTGTFRLDAISGSLPDVPGFVTANGHLVASRTMGVLLSALPAQLLLNWTGASPEALGALTAALMTAAAMATAYCAIRHVVSPRTALAGIGVLAFGTAAWTIAGAELWTHGPDLLWLSLAMLGVSRRSYLLAGLAFAPAVITRPHLALVALPLGIWAAWHERRLLPLVQFAVPGAAAVAALYTWNGWYYGQGSITGAYGGHIERAIGATQSSAVPSLWFNILGTTVSPWCGVLLFTPVVVVAVLGLRHVRLAPGWTKALAIGALLYLLGQFRVANFDGGGAQYGNRYLIEPMLLTLPLGLVCARTWVGTDRIRRALVACLGATSVAIYAVGALLTPFWQGISGNWVAWYPYVVVRTAGVTGVVVTAAAVLAVTICSRLAWQSAPAGSVPRTAEVKAAARASTTAVAPAAR